MRTQIASRLARLEQKIGTGSRRAEGDIGVVRDNARQLKFKAESTSFED
jgi:hypothetical protein